MTILLIDGDVMAYLACKPRWEKKTRYENGVPIRTLGPDGKTLALEFTVEEDRQYLEESWDNFQKRLVELQDRFYTDEFLMGVKGQGNYRDILYPEYKNNRQYDPDSIGVKFVPTIRKLAVHEGLAIESTGREVDDLLRIWAIQAMEAGDDYAVLTIDKDLKCIPGKYYHLKTNTIEVITPEAAMRHYFEQMLKGDSTDGIPGVPGLGPVKATKILAPFSSECEFQEQIVDQYMRAYGDDWYCYFLSNAKMIHLQQHENDYFSCSHWPIIKELM
jgi:5'-3' exonuclease